MLRQISEKHSDVKLGSDEIILDIETTGLNRHRDAVFLVGIQSATHFSQWLIASRSEEATLLAAVLPKLAGHRVLTWNGDAFDLPFLQTRAEKYGLLFPDPISLDWYAFFRKNRMYYSLPNLKLATFQQMAGITRKEQHSGKEIATLLSHIEQAKKDTLETEGMEKQVLLHNREDVSGLASLLPFLYQLSQKLHLSHPSATLTDSRIEKDYLIVHYLTEKRAAMERHFHNTFGQLDWKGQDLSLHLPIHYVPNRIAAVSASYATDVADPPLPAPFLTIEKDGVRYASNIHQLARDLFSFE